MSNGITGPDFPGDCNSVHVFGRLPVSRIFWLLAASLAAQRQNPAAEPRPSDSSLPDLWTGSADAPGEIPRRDRSPVFGGQYRAGMAGSFGDYPRSALGCDEAGTSS